MSDAISGLDFQASCSLHNHSTDTPCGERAFFSCRLPHTEAHGGDPAAVHLLCYRCRAQQLTLKAPFNCPFCGAAIETIDEWITDIKEL